MRSVKSALFLLGTSVIAINAAVGCSGDDGRIEFVDGTEDGGSKANLPETGAPAPTTTGTNDPPPPNDKKDAGASDADADPDSGGGGDTNPGPDGGNDGSTVTPPDSDAGAPGSACATADTIQQQPCGLCGVQYRLCAPNDDDPGSSPVWQPWGFCQNEVEDGCVPGTSMIDNCGLCGTRQKVCQSDCRWAAGACKGEPANACSPGSVDYQAGLSCGEGGRKRVCQNNCTFGAFGECFVPGEPALTLSTTVGGITTGQFKLEARGMIPRLSGDCPEGDADNSATPYQYIALENPGPTALKVAVWSHKATTANAEVIDTIMASYGDTKPTTIAEREACVGGVIDGCPDNAAGPGSCLNSWAALYDDNAIIVPAEGKAYVYVAGYWDTSVGDYQLSARTEAEVP